MFSSKVINNLLSAHVSFASVFQKLMLGLVLADLQCGWDCSVTWSELCPEPCMLLGRPGVLVAPKQVLNISSAKCVVLILYFVLLFFRPSKCFPCGLDPTRRCHLTVGRRKNTVGPTSTSCCVLNYIFNENELQDNFCAHPPLPAPAFVGAEYKRLSGAPSSGWQTRKCQIRVQVTALPFLNVGVATGSHRGTLALPTRTVLRGAAAAQHVGPLLGLVAPWTRLAERRSAGRTRPPATLAPPAIRVAQVVSGRHGWWCPGDCHPWSARGGWMFSAGFPMNHFFSCYLMASIPANLCEMPSPRVSFHVPLGCSCSWLADH